MRRTADAVVVGAGIVGASIGLELARLGLKPVVVDRNADAGEGSTRMSSAIIRSFYGTKPGVALAYEGRHVYESWAGHLEFERPRARFERVGSALVLNAREPHGDAVAALLRSVGVTVEVLGGREAQGLVPGMRAARTKVVFEPGAGYVTSPQQAARDVRAAAEARGARFQFGDAVAEIRSRPHGRNGGRAVRSVLFASGQRLDAPVVVNAAGPHSARINLLARSPLPLATVPLAQRIIRGKTDVTDRLPVVADLPSGHYVRFDAQGFTLGTLAARDDWDFVFDADARLRIPKTFLGERRRAFHRRHPAIRWKDAKVRTALYDVTVLDWYPILDRTDLDGYYVAIGTSGAWFKGAPTLGWLMAQLISAVESGRDHDKDPLRLTLPRTKLPFDLGFLSRKRPGIRSELGRGVLGVIEPWRLLSSRLLFDGGFHRLRLDRCITGRGIEVHDCLVREVADIALVFALTPDDQVVLVRQYRHGASTLSLELPQGLFEPGEGPLAAGARELLEETGYAASSLTPVAELLAHPAVQTSRVHVLLGRGARRTSEPQPEADEDLEVVLVGRAEIEAWIRRGEIRAASSVAGALLALGALGHRPP